MGIGDVKKSSGCKQQELLADGEESNQNSSLHQPLTMNFMHLSQTKKRRAFTLFYILAIFEQPLSRYCSSKLIIYKMKYVFLLFLLN